MIPKEDYKQIIDCAYSRLIKLEQIAHPMSPAYLEQANKYMGYVTSYSELFGEVYKGTKLYN